MDFGAIITAIGGGLVAIGAVLVIMGMKGILIGNLQLTPTGLLVGGIGLLMLLLGSSMSERNEDRSLREPPQLAQPIGYQNPQPGGPIYGNPGAGWRPDPSQMPGGFNGYPPPPPVGPGGGYPGNMPLQGPINLSGTFTGTAYPNGGVAGPCGTLALESGAQRVALRQ